MAGRRGLGPALARGGVGGVWMEWQVWKSVGRGGADTVWWRPRAANACVVVSELVGGELQVRL